MVPISSRVEKYHKIEAHKLRTFGRCNTIRFGTVLGREAAFLIQNMFPVTEKYLIQYKDKNQQPIHIDGRIVTDVRRHASEVLALYRRGATCFLRTCRGSTGGSKYSLTQSSGLS